ncbi:hypothetical protein [Acinetobacter baumannii]|uniref:hypothetical protein n=1 Tax=Acinetobacter baumannii TaxID=470 RepID=UPI00070738FA|nr:hypothetical protein [Acinetobacter baumannii]KQD41169.1 hypothetical protein APD15_10535 [Acinetobacter baumannii]KQD42472.1 hypothetical protein APD15_04220 [Acinetobacter baumannii]OTK98888.1 hypothetical protein B9X84_09930 [Acinetobacter baumannii]
MDSNWIEQQRRVMEKLISPDLIKPIELDRQKCFQEMVKDSNEQESRKLESLNRIKKYSLVDLRGAIKDLAKKYKQDARALTLLGDQDKARVYNGIANQLDHLLKGGA